MKFFKLPDLGEGLMEAEIVEWHVKPGDKVEVDQLLVSVETAKAIVEVPSPVTAEVAQLLAQEGEVVQTNGAIVEFVVADDYVEPGTVVGDIPEEVTSIPEESAEPFTKPYRIEELADIEEYDFSGAERGKFYRDAIFATPAVKLIAKQKGIDLSTIEGSGPNGQIVRKDLEKPKAATVSFRSEPEVGVPLKGPRRAMAEAMTASLTVPTATVFDDIRLMHTDNISSRILDALCKAVKKVPILNSHYDSYRMTVNTHSNLDIGIAVDTEDGLFVPVLKNADRLSSTDLYIQYKELILKARQRKLSPAELTGSTIMLSNFGTIGGKYATPIVVPPNVAILGIGAPYVSGEDVFLPVSLTFDHRPVTGGEAARFLRAFKESF